MFGIASNNGRARARVDSRECVGPAAEQLAAAASAPITAATIAPPARDLEFERDWTRQAGESIHVDVDDLIRFAESRAGGVPVRQLQTRDFTREVLEELADARNYLVWRAQQELGRAVPDGEVVGEVARALQSVAVAFAAASLLRTWERGA